MKLGETVHFIFYSSSVVVFQHNVIVGVSFVDVLHVPCIGFSGPYTSSHIATIKSKSYCALLTLGACTRGIIIVVVCVCMFPVCQLH